MAKQLPKHLVEKAERANRLMAQIVDINIELERWIEKNGIAPDGFDFLYHFRECEGYDYSGVGDMVNYINAALAK